MNKALLISIFLAILLLPNVVHAWYNVSYPFRYQIIENKSTEETIAVNGTNGIGGSILWALTNNDSYVYTTSSWYGSPLLVANVSTLKNYEWDNNLTGNNQTKVFGNNAVGVWHFSENGGTQSQDSLYQHNLTGTNAVLGNNTGIFGNAFYSDSSGCFQTNSSLDLSNTNKMTVTYWIKFFDTDSAYQGFTENQNSPNGFYMAISCGSNLCQGEFVFKDSGGGYVA
jgi:hypothetical protein